MISEELSKRKLLTADQASAMASVVDFSGLSDILLQDDWLI